MSAVNQLTDGFSKALGTDGSGGGLAGEISNLGKSIADSPIASAAISAAAAYFGVPPTMTATLLGLNKAGQKGDLMAGLQTGLMSYGVGQATNYLTNPSTSMFGASGGSASATTAEAAGAAGDTIAVGGAENMGTYTVELADPSAVGRGVVAETSGLAKDSNLLDWVQKTGGNVIDKLGKAADKIITDKPEYLLLGGLNTVGGMYSAAQRREEAEKQRQSAIEQINQRDANDQAAIERYNRSFNLATQSANKFSPLRRSDGSRVFDSNGRQIIRSA